MSHKSDNFTIPPGKFSPLALANNILARAKKEDEITPLKLKCLIYLIDEAYKIRENIHLISERIIIDKQGIFIPSIDIYFNPYKKTTILDYFRDASNEVYHISEKETFSSIINEVWKKYSTKTELELFYMIAIEKQ